VLQNIKDEMKGRLSYYQGLNYVAGFAMIVMADPLLSSKLVLTLIERFLLKYISVDLVQVKKSFFMYERLIQIFLPKVYRKFKQERIGVDLFSTSWILTIFSLLSQYEAKNTDLAEIWDIFIATGWPGFFRVLVAVLRLKEQVILKMSYEDLMNLFCSMPKLGTLNSPSSKDPSPKDHKSSSFKQQIASIPITEDTLRQIEHENLLIEKELETTWTLLRETEY